MNFKTTLVLIGLLFVAGIVLLVTRDSGDAGSQEAREDAQKLFSVDAADISKLTLTSADGEMTSLERSGGKWRMLQPVSAEAEAFEVDSLVRSIANLQSQGTTDAQQTGLDKPQYTIDFTTGDGKSHTLRVGNKTAIGDNLYVSKKDEGRTHVVAAEFLQSLEKAPADFRAKKLVEMAVSDVTRIEIDRPDGKVVLAKSGENWNVVEPQKFPAEKADVDNVLFDLTGLRAVEFVSENAAADGAQYDLARPRITATLSTTRPALPDGVAAPTTAAPTTAAPTTAAPTTDAPTTDATTQAATQPAPLVVKFGRFVDVLKENVYVTTSQSPVVATVAARIIETINKKPIELRDRKVLDVDPAEVSTIRISSDLAATTQPTSRPASKQEVVIRRRVAQAPATQATTAAATTQAATTQATTAPAATAQAATAPTATQPATTWEVVASAGEIKPADDSKVDQLLAQLHPLRAQKYLEAAPTTQPTGSYTLSLSTQGSGSAPARKHEITLVDPGDMKPLIGTYNGLAFEVDRSMVDRISGDFLQGSAPADSAPGSDFGDEGFSLPTGP